MMSSIMTRGTKWLTSQEAADALAVTPDTVRRWIAEGKLAAARLPGGREFRIYADDLPLALVPVDTQDEDEAASEVEGGDR